MRETIIILQNEIMAYRKPLYNMLAQYYRVIIIHAGRPSKTPDDVYEEKIISSSRIGPFFIQKWLPSSDIRKSPKAIIAMADLRWPSYILPVFLKRRTRYILWGGWYSHRYFVDKIKDFISRQADALLLYGDEEIETMVERGIDRQTIFVAPNTIHVPDYRDFSTHAKSSLLFVGRLIRRKRPDLLIEAFARVAASLPPGIVVDIVGDGDQRQLLESLAISLNVQKKIRFHGAVTDPRRLSELFASAYAYVSPEHIGLGGLHSFGHGVAVITRAPRPDSLGDTRYGPEFLNLKSNGNALIYEYPEELDQQIVRICTEPDLARKLGHNGFQHYSTARTMENMVAGFREAIETETVQEAKL